MRIAWLLMASVLGCTSKGAPEPTVEEFLEAPASVEIAPAMEPTSPKARVRTRQLPDPGDERWASVQYNLTVAVTDPSAAVEQVRDVLLESGATIQNASRQAGSGYVNATVDDKGYAKLVAQLEEIDGSVVSESTSRNDLGPQIRQLRDRLDLVRRADAQLTTLSQGADADGLDALMLQRELNHRERQNLDNQIRSYWDQAGKSFVHLNFQAEG